MAVRREVVSLSQLLQRRNSARREGSLSLSQASSVDFTTPIRLSSSTAPGRAGNKENHGSSSVCSAVSASRGAERPEGEGLSGVQQQLQQVASQDQSSTSFGPFKSMATSQPTSYSQSLSGGIQFPSQSQDATQEDSLAGCETTQSQSQSLSSQTPAYSQPPTADSATHNQRVYQPRQLSQSDKISTVIAESAAAVDRIPPDSEEVLSRLVAPITSSLKQVKSMLAEQSEHMSDRTSAEIQVRNDLRSMKKAVERLEDMTCKTNEECEDCHEKIAKDVRAARRAFEDMSTRMGSMEETVDSFIANMTVFVREELFALQYPHERRPTIESVRSIDRFSCQTSTRHCGKQPLGQHYLTPHYTSPRSLRRSSNQKGEDSRREGSKGGWSGPYRRSERIKRLQKKKKSEIDSHGKGDQFGMELALELVEEARARRRRNL